ncbi:MAG: AI-2E family transporter [bacterium]
MSQSDAAAEPGSDANEEAKVPDSSELSEVSEALQDENEPLKPRRRRRPPKVREYILPLMTVFALLVLLINFRTVLLPFVFACLLVYLMEPLVSRMGRTAESPKGLPRWLAVMIVYIVSLSAVTAFLIAIVPRFVSEFVRLGETVPELVNELRTEQLPKLDEQVGQFVGAYVPTLRSVDVTRVASNRMLAARKAAASAAGATAIAHAAVRRAVDVKLEYRQIVAEDGSTLLEYSASAEPPGEEWSVQGSLEGGRWRFALNEDPAFRLVPDKSGGIQVYLNNVDLEIQHFDDRWVVRRTKSDALPPLVVPDSKGLSLQKNVDDLLQEFVDNSTSQIGQLIELARKLAVGILEGFLAVMLTMMVAAFISIDLHRLKRFVRGMFPEEARLGFDNFVAMADRGMAGVIRGQLIICTVNGILTYIGLAILGVRFSLLLAVLAAILSLIPVFGTVLSTVPIVAIAITDGFSTGLLALTWILLIHFLEANFLNPKIIGQSAHIHPVIVIFALLAGESAYGLVGALLAVPTASLVLTVFHFVRLRAWRSEENLETVA